MENFWIFIASRLPRELAYWVFIRVCCYKHEGNPGDQSTHEAAKRWKQE